MGYERTCTNVHIKAHVPKCWRAPLVGNVRPFQPFSCVLFAMCTKLTHKLQGWSCLWDTPVLLAECYNSEQPHWFWLSSRQTRNLYFPTDVTHALGARLAQLDIGLVSWTASLKYASVEVIFYAECKATIWWLLAFVTFRFYYGK